MKNLRDGLKELMARKQKELPEVEEASSDGIPLRAQGKRRASALEASPKPDEPEKQWRSMSQGPRHIAASSEHSSVAPSGSQISRTNRATRYEAVREIARRLHMSRQTVQKFLIAESFPERSTPSYRGSILDPYKPYILDRWKAGCWNGSQLYTEVKELGYTGSETLFRLFISSIRKQHQATGTSEKLELSAHGAKVSGPIDPPSKLCITRRLSPARASWLYVSQAVKLDEKQRQQVAHIRAAHDDLDSAYELTQAFVSMLTEHQETALDIWLAQAEHSGIKELKSFATSHPARLRRRACHVHFRMEQRSG